jgi:hypothetical protein
MSRFDSFRTRLYLRALQVQDRQTQGPDASGRLAIGGLARCNRVVTD